MFALADCNSFFASCEQAFRPDLRNKAVVVLSNNDGCIVARTREAKKLGIPMGEAYFKIKRLVESGQVHVFSGNYALYNDFSNRVMNYLARWTPNIEIYSIDEAFLNFDGMKIDDFAALGREISLAAKQCTCIPVSVGMAPTKTLAKVANETAKSRRCGSLAILDDETRISILKEFDLGDVWGVGRALVKKFRTLGLRTAYDLAQVDPLWMRKKHSVVQEKMVRELNGEPCFDLDSPQPKKNIMVSRSFGETTDRLEDLEEAVATFAGSAASKVRKQGSVATAVYVQTNTSWFRKDEEYYSNSAIETFPVPTVSTPEIIEAAFRALRKIYRPEKQYKRAAVMLLDLADAEAAKSQGFLFEKDEVRTSERRETEQRLMESLDRINDRFGRKTVFFGAEGVKVAWKQNRNMVSPAYTTDSDDFPIAWAK